jgi:hypothetical protein
VGGYAWPMLSQMRVIALAAALASAGPSAHAASPFDGLWVADLKTQMGQSGFDDYLVARGIYKCLSCRPPREYPADGKMRSVPGDASVISEGVIIAGPRSIVTRILDHEMTRVTTMKVAPDSRTATYVSLDHWPGHSKLLRTDYVAQRIKPAPPGAHPVSGSWLGLRYVTVPQEYRSVRLKEANGRFTRIDFRHGHYTATIGGPPAAVTGDGKGIFKAAVRAPDVRTRIETISLRGKPLVERTYRLSADGKSLATITRDPADGSTFSTISHRR